ncbi:MAG: GNAT family N-acetyltransferase [Dehalococcoidia bacterium]|nr:GNAT family N-acetyltransferase [Dehalococcoidia bacterium]
MSTPRNEFGQPIGPEIPNWTPPGRPARLCLHGSYCRVEPLDLDSHLLHLFEAFSTADPDWTYLAYGPFKDFSSFRDWAQGTCMGEDPLFYSLIDNGPGTPSGMASYLRIAPASGTIEVGHIHLGPDLKRSRAATEAMFLMMDYAFSLGYRRYEWKCNALNAPPRDAALRLGFTFEGTWRQASLSRGRNRDTCWYSIIDADWPRLRAGFQRWLDPDNFDNNGLQRRRLQDYMDPHQEG